MARVKVEGLRELGEAMKSLGKEVSTKIARAMNNAGAQVVKKAAKANREKDNAPEPYKVDGEVIQPGNIARNIIVKRLPKGETDLTVEHIVTVRHKKVTGKPYRAAIFAEFGTVKLTPKPFLRPAFESSKADAINTMKKVGGRRIEAAARKAKKK